MPFTAGQIGGTWVAGAGGPVLVQNTLDQSIPGSGSIRFALDFGNLQEILDGDLVASCAIAIAPTTSPALTVVGASTTITNGYLVSALFTGGAAGTYTVTFTPTLVSGQVLPPRTGTLRLQ